MKKKNGNEQPTELVLCCEDGEKRPLLRFLAPEQSKDRRSKNPCYQSLSGQGSSLYFQYSPPQRFEDPEYARSRLTLAICVALLVAAAFCWPLVVSSLEQDNTRSYSLPFRDTFRDYSATLPPIREADASARCGRLGSKSGCHQEYQYSSSSSSSSSNSEISSPRTIPHEQSTSTAIPHVHSTSTETLGGFPSFLDYGGAPLSVQYNAHSILLNDQPVLLLGGSMHPTRAGARGEWERALDEAVHNGLNLITMYVFWSAHQPFEDEPLDWSLPYSRSIQEGQEPINEDNIWSLSQAISSCADRGLFVHLRLGPYNCAEYSYGGIPEWVGVKHPDIRIRRMDPVWLDLMEGYITNATKYITDNKLWAHQGGPVILGQIENELGDDNGGFMMEKDNANEPAKLRSIEVQEYANWCGDLVQRVAPKSVVWTMCNGLTAKNTIETFNGDWTAVSWLEDHGNSGRIQVDHPAVWTEVEQGFQVWGESPEKPVDYFWGISASDVSKNALRWLARGALHVNYYMFWGGYNRGRIAAAGIMNAYATDGVLCPSGERREPKFGQLSHLHHALATIAPILTSTWPPPKPQTVEVQDVDGSWSIGLDQIAFTYSSIQHDSLYTPNEVIFVENNGDQTLIARVASISTGYIDDGVILELNPYSVVILVDGDIAFGSSTISPDASDYSRTKMEDVVSLLDWNSWQEPAAIPTTCENDQTLKSFPIEQTILNHNETSRDRDGRRVLSDYAWYSTRFLVGTAMDEVTLVIDTDKGMGMLVYVDGKYCGMAENHEHSEGPISFNIPIASGLAPGWHDLAILSESLGYQNLIGRWHGREGPKVKGITGNVTFVGTSAKHNKEVAISLTQGDFQWCSIGGLQGERIGLTRLSHQEFVWAHLNAVDSSFARDGPIWAMAYFDTPLFGVDQRLFLELTAGRGHVWLNGHDLGRYWNITRSSNNNATSDSDSSNNIYSQRFYYLPQEFLTDGSSLNELVIVNVLGDRFDGTAQLVLSWIEPSAKHEFEDTIGFEDSCLV